MGESRDPQVLIVSRLGVHGKVLSQAMARVSSVRWVGEGLQYRMSLPRLPVILLAELVGLFRGYKSMRGQTRPVVIVQFVSLDVVPAYVFRRLTRCRVLLYAIGSDILGRRGLGQTAFLSWAVKGADCVMCVNRTIEEQVRQLGGSRTVVLPTAFAGFASGEEEEKVFDVVTVGALIPLKRQSLLIDSCGRLSKPTKVAIVGGGPLKASLTLQGARYPKHEFVFLGEVPRDEVSSVLRRSRLYVQCSSYEGVPLSVLEAMWCGVPVIAVASGYTTDLVELYHLNLLVVREQSPAALARAIAEALENGQEFASMGSRNVEALQEYARSWSQGAQGILEAYS
jgi:glycosyltransferase involved in cell wall biosynthesis